MSDSFSGGLRKFGEKIEKIAKTETVSFPDLFNPDFMRKHAKVPTIEALFEAGGFDVNSPEDFAAIPDEEWEANIRANTFFKSWEEMQRTAGAEWVMRQLEK